MKILTPTGARLLAQTNYGQGNIDLNNRPVVKNLDGSVSTIRSITITEDGKAVLIPTVSPDGKILTNKEAIDLYQKTGQNLGKFNSEAEANGYAQRLHTEQAQKLGIDTTLTPVNENQPQVTAPTNEVPTQPSPINVGPTVDQAWNSLKELAETYRRKYTGPTGMKPMDTTPQNNLLMKLGQGGANALTGIENVTSAANQIVGPPLQLANQKFFIPRLQAYNRIGPSIMKSLTL